MELYFQIYIFYLVSTKCFAIIYLALLSLDCSRRQNPAKPRKVLLIRKLFAEISITFIFYNLK